MIISNKKRATAIKRLFYIVGIIMAIFMLIMFLTDHNLTAILTGAAFIIWFFVFQLFDFQYIDFMLENQKITLRYYPAVKFGKKDYQMIEFASNMLHDVQFENTLFGLVTDIAFVVKTKRGIAEYPSVSLAAVSPEDLKKIKKTIFELLEK